MRQLSSCSWNHIWIAGIKTYEFMPCQKCAYRKDDHEDWTDMLSTQTLSQAVSSIAWYTYILIFTIEGTRTVTHAQALTKSLFIFGSGDSLLDLDCRLLFLPTRCSNRLQQTVTCIENLTYLSKIVRSWSMRALVDHLRRKRVLQPPSSRSRPVSSPR